MSHKPLYSKEAIDKIKKLAEDIDFCMMITDLKKQPFHVIPMSTKEVDESGNIWFLSNANSSHNQNLKMDPNIHLIYSDKINFEFLSVFGQAVVSKDKDRIKDLYGSGDDAWFDGVDDPNITALKVVPGEVYYWDTKHGKLISLLKMAGGAITGNEPDLGTEGELKI